MSDYNLRDRFLSVLKGKAADRVPVLSVTQTGTVSLMEKCGVFWPEAHSNPEKMAALSLAAHEITKLEAVRYPYCVTVLSEAMGCEVSRGTKEIQPYVKVPPLGKSGNLPEIPDSLLEMGRIPTVLKATSLLKDKTEESLPLIVGIESPAALCSRLLGANNYLGQLLRSPDYIRECLEINTEACIEYANALFEEGADAVCVPDGISGPDLLSLDIFDRLIKPAYRRFCKKARGMKILHMCGNAFPFLETLSECGFEGISVEEKVWDLKGAKKSLGKGICLIGNVASSSTLLFGSPEDVKAEARKSLEGGVDILAPSCGIAPLTPLENMKALVEARDEYYVSSFSSFEGCRSECYESGCYESKYWKTYSK
ncbi:TPA: MtaA/CmuA family methyltransferase [Methanosarcina acetivorans]|uniref:Methylcobamide:CoM methyltransferase isozyme M n=2 Tax=Methanosarcina acetivorans TaxID=2214 RepID=Q8THF8_METAC|nr:methylcobamide:CoM methyltransferase MtaA [Methanosarcina acetivorans]AAM07898.1 methylcobamide:CoM methyltransferase isozyme M [Methanosarcina acetivorans C2A]HIH92522.1 MtaA/CmuA family methyltransferase [Methanosarcina acetivorans]